MLSYFVGVIIGAVLVLCVAIVMAALHVSARSGDNAGPE